MRTGQLLTLVLFLSVAFAHSSYASCESEVLRSNLGVRNTYPSPRDLAKRARQDKFRTTFPGHAGARWLRFRLKVQPEPVDAPWSLVIRNQYGQVLESYGNGSVALYPDGTTWTGRLPADRGLIFDTWPVAPTGVLKISEYVAMIEPAGEKAYYSTAEPGLERWKPIEDSGANWAWRRQADSVALVMPSWEHENRGCTGFAVASDLLITNWHCGWIEDLPDRNVWNDQICRSTMIDFSFDGDQRSAEYRCSHVFVSNRGKELDYVLLQITPVDRARRVRGMTLATGRRKHGAPLAVIHHPAGLRKQLSRECSILEAEKSGWQNEVTSRFTRFCDTAPGTSGAPVLDVNTHRVIGLHHRGVERDSQTCEENEDPRRNKAIWIGAIVADLEANRLQIEAELKHPLSLNTAD